MIFLIKVSTPLPLLRLLGLPTIFYCHYPDLLLSTDRTSLLKRLYRLPLDWLEQWTTGLADILLVNSNFTKEVFRNTFPRLNRLEPAVLYPSLSTKIFQVLLRSIYVEVKLIEHIKEEGTRPTELPPGDVTFLSLNRFERKKNVALAIRAFAAAGGNGRLVVAGGWDSRLGRF